MKICDFMRKLYEETENTPEFYQKSCDTLKAGDPEREITRIATAMFATPAVIKEASGWGADLLIVHEPTFYDHWDDLSGLDDMPEPQRSLIRAKLELIKKSGLTIYRFHDHPHRRETDYIAEGELSRWGLKGKFEKGEFYAVNDFLFDEPLPVMELAGKLEKNLNIRKIRIFGSTKTICRRAGLCFGTPGHLMEELQKNDVVLTGEICEWREGEFVRDYTALTGTDKSILVMGHIGSERDGMKLLADVIAAKYPHFPVRYFDCGESWTFTC